MISLRTLSSLSLSGFTNPNPFLFLGIFRENDDGMNWRGIKRKWWAICMTVTTQIYIHISNISLLLFPPFLMFSGKQIQRIIENSAKVRSTSDIIIINILMFEWQQLLFFSLMIRNRNAERKERRLFSFFLFLFSANDIILGNVHMSNAKHDILSSLWSFHLMTAKKKEKKEREK